MKFPFIGMFLLGPVNCKDFNDIPIDPIDQLPPPTMERKNIFRCLVNGEPFITRLITDAFGVFQGGTFGTFQF